MAITTKTQALLAMQAIRSKTGSKDLEDVLRYLLDPVDLVEVTDAATYTVLADDSGSTIVLPNLTASITMTLPRAVAGLEYTFMYGGAAADAQNWIINTGAATELYAGGVVHLDSDAQDLADEVVPVFADFVNDDTLTVTTPTAGTSIHVISDGTSWYVNGTVVSATAPAFS
jgi:hypothetical protein